MSPEVEEGDVDLFDVRNLLLCRVRVQVAGGHLVKVNLELKLLLNVLPEHAQQV